MNDVFYFTRNLVTLEDIAGLADEIGYRHDSPVNYADSIINVWYRDDRFWQFIAISAAA